jgi:hypothetical protein
MWLEYHFTMHTSAQCDSVFFNLSVSVYSVQRENAQREMERRIVAQLLTCLDELGKGENQVSLYKNLP